MKIVNRYAGFLRLALLVSLPGMVGCASMFGRNKVEQTTKVETISDVPELTSAEREQRFREATNGGARLVEQGQYGLALGAFEEAASLKPDSIEALFNLGACYENIGDPMKAISIYRCVLEIVPEDADCYVNLGTSYIKLYHRENSPIWRRLARKSWERSLQLNPDQPDVKKYLAMTESPD